MEETIFTKIIKGEIPAHKIYEDELTIAFLDIHPKLPGHTLVIPKQQVEFVWDLDDELYQALLLNCRKVARHLRSVLGAKYVHMGVVGTDVPHAHIHLIPFNKDGELSREQDTQTEPNHTALAEMAEKLRIS